MSNALNINEPKQEPTNKGFLIVHQHEIGKLTAVFILLFGFFALQLWLHIHHASPTFDEPFHTWAGYSYWQCGNYAICPDHPPLLKLLAALPIKSQQLTEIAKPCNLKEGFWGGAQFLERNGFDRVLIPARLAASVMSLLLAGLVFLAAWEMFGKVEACVALAIMTFEPNLIAHGSLVTTDMAATTTIFATVYALYRYCQRRNVCRLLLTGLALGLMLASKFSGLPMLPVLLLLLLADTLLMRRDATESNLAARDNSALRHGVAFAVVCIIALCVLWATYGLRYHALPSNSTDTVSLNEFLILGSHHEVADSTSGKIVQFLHRTHVFPESYTLGLAYQVATTNRGAYLLGKWYPTGQWFYFPIAFTIKSSIALLLLLPLALLMRELYRKHPREMLFLMLPSFAYFAISLTLRLNIGVRHILPVYPFFIIIAAAGACVLSRRYRVFSFVLGALLLLHVFTAVRTAPNYIAFTNDFWGGTNNTYRLLNDSNVEWSQNLKTINEYVEKKGVHDCWFAPFGWGEILHHYQPCNLIPGGFVLRQPDQVAESMPPVIDGTVFISTAAITPPARPEYEPILKTKPVAMLGGSILVFRGRYEVSALAARSHVERASKLVELKRFDEAVMDSRKAIELAPNDPHTHLSLAMALTERASQLVELKRFDEAIVDSQKAVELAPNDPRTHLALGMALAHTVKRDEARQELAEAIRLSQSHTAQHQSTELQARQMLQHLQ